MLFSIAKRCSLSGNEPLWFLSKSVNSPLCRCVMHLCLHTWSPTWAVRCLLSLPHCLGQGLSQRLAGQQALGGSAWLYHAWPCEGWRRLQFWSPCFGKHSYTLSHLPRPFSSYFWRTVFLNAVFSADSVSLGLKLQKCMGHYMGPGNWTLSLWKTSKCSDNWACCYYIIFRVFFFLSRW